MSKPKPFLPKPDPFAKTLLKWFGVHGRKNLPWQKSITPYRVWLSEIMLQQTQVETVIPYFNRFVKAFPNFKQLNTAKPDDVLHLWAGLGYYARARNLHKCAQTVVTQFNGKMPSSVEELISLPGIGRSTAGAIVSIAYEKPAPILDGNVKRVLARYHAIQGWPGNKAVEDALWKKAVQHTPRERCRDYTQAIMDLGATLCTRSSPDCPACPFKRTCKGLKQGLVNELPGKKPKKALPVKQIQMLLIKNKLGEILLEKRPPHGIWGGLWSLPELDLETDSHTHCLTRFGKTGSLETLPAMRHTFSHYHLDISPVLLTLSKPLTGVTENNLRLWYNMENPPSVGLAAPVKKLLSLAHSK